MLAQYLDGVPGCVRRQAAARHHQSLLHISNEVEELPAAGAGDQADALPGQRSRGLPNDYLSIYTSLQNTFLKRQKNI